MTTKTGYDINIAEVSKTETNGLEYSKLVLNFYGKDVSTTLINTIRRILLENIPTYAFSPDSIMIEKNTSVFNNDYMKLRLSQLPIPNIKLDLNYLPLKFLESMDYSKKDRVKHPAERRIEMYIDMTNNTGEILNVTTNDIKYFEDNDAKNVGYSKEFPICLIQLRTGEQFKCHMVGVLGTGENNAIWSAVSSVSAFPKIQTNKIDEKNETIIDETKYMVNIESNGQFTEYELVKKACWYLIEKLRDIMGQLMETSTSTKTDKVELKMDKETFTIGNILTDTLQNRSDVQFAGVSRPNFLVKSVVIKVQYKEELKDPMRPVYESIEDIISKMRFISDKIDDINPKTKKMGKIKDLPDAKSKSTKKK